MDDDNNSYFIVNGNGYKLFCKQWEPKSTPPIALVFISHGFTEHCLYYGTVARALAEMGCFVHSHDHVGHGRSEGPKVQIDNFDTYVRDLFQHTDLIKQRYPDTPFYFLGHSMGTTIGIIATMKKPNYFKGLMVMSVTFLLSNKAVTPFTSKLCQLIGWMFPNLPFFPLDYTLATRDPDMISIRINDPFSWHSFAKIGWCRAILRAIEDIHNNVEAIESPLLVMHGDSDKTCSSKGAKMFYEKCSSPDKTLKIYPKAYHNLLDEPEGIKEQVLEDIILWLKERVK